MVPSACCFYQCLSCSSSSTCTISNSNNNSRSRCVVSAVIAVFAVHAASSWPIPVDAVNRIYMTGSLCIYKILGRRSIDSILLSSMHAASTSIIVHISA